MNTMSFLRLGDVVSFVFTIASLSWIGFSVPDSLDNHCIGKEDGEYWLQLSDAESNYKPVKVLCSNEYMVIDISKDSNLADYFSSYEMWHYKLAGPANHDPVTWQEWFLQSNDNSNSKYLISPDCNSCESDNQRQVYDDTTTYWMTGNLAKLHWGVIGFNECDMDWDSYQCYDCQACLLLSTGCEPDPYNDTATDFSTSGICGVTVQPSNKEIETTRELAQESNKQNYKPSIGTEGEFCVCYQPSQKESFVLTQEQKNMIEQRDLKEETPQNMAEQSSQKNEETENSNNIYYLSQSDFAEGTLRIRQSGTYIITEDIVFDFGKDSDYWPTADQNSDNLYPGAASYRDAYHLGFFAGITIECNDVVIDLNGYELSQSLEFYYQQRWFAIIELGNQQFLPGQGPAFFGSSPVMIENTEIRNGILGLTSHFGIHGNFPTNIKVENLKIRHFVTHGMQLNGWNNLIMNNVEIGPSSTIEYLRGEYGHCRILIQRLREIETTLIEEGTIDNEENLLSFTNFNNEKKSISDIADEMEDQMSLALEYAINRANDRFAKHDYIDPSHLASNEAKAQWIKAKNTFVHESGFPSSSSISGLFLNFQGASVFSYTTYTTHQSQNGELSNIHIHDINHDMVESMRFAYSTTSPAGQMYPTPWNSDIPAEHAFGGKENLFAYYMVLANYKDDKNDTFLAEQTMDIIKRNERSLHHYDGSILTDAYFAMGSVSDDWDLLGFLKVREINKDYDDLISWVNGEYEDSMLSWVFGCNQDIMGHSGKGLLGMRVDGVDQLKLSNIKIENLYQHGVLGSDACGEYEQFKPEIGGGHFKQLKPMQVGYSGNDLQGMSIISSTNVYFENDIIISNLYNRFSRAFGLSLWSANDIYFTSDELFMKITNIQSGFETTMYKETKEEISIDYDNLKLPNKKPESCAVRMQFDGSSDLLASTVNVDNDGKNNIIACNVYGRDSCLSDQKSEMEWTMYGNYFESSESCDEINSYDDLQALLLLQSLNENNENNNNNNNDENENAIVEESDNDNDNDNNEQMKNVIITKETEREQRSLSEYLIQLCIIPAIMSVAICLLWLSTNRCNTNESVSKQKNMDDDAGYDVTRKGETEIVINEVHGNKGNDNSHFVSVYGAISNE